MCAVPDRRGLTSRSNHTSSASCRKMFANSGPASRVLRGTPTSRRPSRVASLPSLRATAAIQRSVTTGAPRFLENPCDHALLSDPGGAPRQAFGQVRFFGVSLWPSAVSKASASHDNHYLEARSHGLAARCLRFAARVAAAPRKTRSRLVASLAGRDFHPLGSIVRFRVLGHVILLTQAWPGALRPMLRTKVGGCGIREIESGGSPAEVDDLPEEGACAGDRVGLAPVKSPG